MLLYLTFSTIDRDSEALALNIFSKMLNISPTDKDSEAVILNIFSNRQGFRGSYVELFLQLTWS